jgi:site-specific DNA-methyltransferase (adenine-specific)/site-specific DNA-methyltransferase (cytosine-N4-specific)
LILEGDARTELASLPNDLFQACITSPPYWGLRDYAEPGQLGAEERLDDYVHDLVEVFEHVRRTLKPDGTLWLNIGDGYTSGDRGWRAPDKKNPSRAMGFRPPTPDGLKPKDLLGVPWRVAFALREAGWYLRSDVIWYKPNCQPESVKDRPTRSHEYLFLFSRSERYYYDADTAREPVAVGQGTRNRRSVWSIPTEPEGLGHPAPFPVGLVEPCLLATTKRGDYVLDPFFGVGTVGLVAGMHGRRYVGIELKREYAEVARRRLAGTQGALDVIGA